MMRRIVIVLVVILVCGCERRPRTGLTTKREMELTEENQARLLAAVPPPKLQTSLERVNLRRYLEEINRDNAITYIYLINYGKVMAFYTIKGKVTYCSSKLTTREQMVMPSGYATPEAWQVLESPGLDGSYGPSEDAIFFWTTEDVRVQWKGDYMWVSEPLRLTTPPELVRMIDEK